MLAKQRFAHVSGFEGECGKSIERVFEVYCHDFDSVPLRFIIFRHPENVRSDCVRFTKGRVVIRIDSLNIPGLHFFGIFDENHRIWIYHTDLNVFGDGSATAADPRRNAIVSIPLASLFPSGNVPDPCPFSVDLCGTNALLQFYEKKMWDYINEFRKLQNRPPLEWSNQMCIVCRDRSFDSRNVGDLIENYFPGLFVAG
jgi:hypothetical protein